MIELRKKHNFFVKKSEMSLTIKVTQFCRDAGDLTIPTAHHYYMGMENTDLNKICLNLKVIKEYSLEKHISFYKLICDVITHETMHYILDNLENEFISYRFDFICKKLREYGCI